MDERKSSQKSRFDRRQWMKLSAVGGLGLSPPRPRCPASAYNAQTTIWVLLPTSLSPHLHWIV